MKKRKTIKKIRYRKKEKRKTRKTKKHRRVVRVGGSKMMQNGNIQDIDETYDGLPFFRKVFFYPDKNPDMVVDLSDAAINEQSIVKLLMEHPHPNIATYYDVNETYVDMEMLNTDYDEFDKKEAINAMKKVKTFLQSLGIIYMDWKIDNVGRGKDGNYKLFDFDGSGIIDINTKLWVNTPVDIFVFREAKKLKIKDPIEMDDWAFNKYLLH
jgi:hypothetical protein